MLNFQNFLNLRRPRAARFFDKIMRLNSHKRHKPGYKLIRKFTRNNFRNRTFWELALANKRKLNLAK